jgi:hypothetical protein
VAGAVLNDDVARPQHDLGSLVEFEHQLAREDEIEIGRCTLMHPRSVWICDRREGFGDDAIERFGPPSLKANELHSVSADRPPKGKSGRRGFTSIVGEAVWNAHT